MAQPSDMRRLGPTSSLSVVWVGHSLVEHHVETSWGRVDLMSLVGKFAQSRGLSYAMTDHTLWGSPLSALWRGSPHSYDRDASEMVAKREVLERDASRYNAIVLTEAVPLKGVIKAEFSSYYLRRFYCTVLSANPHARVYLYQTWVPFQNSPDATAKTLPQFDWRAEMKAERALWDQLADAASKPDVVAPSWLSRLGWASRSDGGCPLEDPVYTVPVGDAMLALEGRLSDPRPEDRFDLPDGKRFEMIDLIENPLVRSADGGAHPRDPARAVDDIHASFVGIYFAALVNFATLYRQTPVGLPAPAELGDDLSKTLQCIAWDSVVRDPRAGVDGKSDC